MYDIYLLLGADVTLPDGDGMTSLHRAVEFDNIEVITMLLDGK